MRYRYDLGDFETTVQPGDRIVRGQVIGERTYRPAPALIDVAGELKRSPKSLLGALSEAADKSVDKGDVLLSISGPLGFGKKAVTSPVKGQVVSRFDDLGALVIQPPALSEPVNTPFSGEVSEVETDSITIDITGTTIEGVAYAGDVVSGRLMPLEDGQSAAGLVQPNGSDEEASARVFALSAPATTVLIDGLARALWRPEPTALIVPSMPYDDFVSAGRAHPTLSIFVTRGFGAIPFGPSDLDPAWKLLMDSAGRDVTVLPEATDRGPVLVVPTDVENEDDAQMPLGVGDWVMLLRELRLRYGTVQELLPEAVQLPSGAFGLALRLGFEDGESTVVSRDDVVILRSGPP